MWIFVYGSLRTGEENAHILGNLPRRSGRVRGRLWRAPEGYPALVIDPIAPLVEGEVVTGADPRLLATLDRFEGVDRGLYERRSVSVEHEGSRTPAFAYVVSERVARERGYELLELQDWCTRPMCRSPG